eukprot:SAG25_NODE_1551_length_2782_cov_2.498693_2_plen_81_part_00
MAHGVRRPTIGDGWWEREGVSVAFNPLSVLLRVEEEEEEEEEQEEEEQQQQQQQQQQDHDDEEEEEVSRTVGESQSLPRF